MHRTTTIRRSLVTNLAWMVVGLGLAIVLMMAFSTRRVIRTLSESLIEQTSSKTELMLRSFFEPVSNRVESFRRAGAAGHIDLERVREQPHILEEVLLEFPHCSAVYLTDETDREIFVTRTGSSWLRREMDPGSGEGVARITEWSAEDRNPVRRQERIEYRPTQRPWFTGAVEAMPVDSDPSSSTGVFWTEPYVFFSSGKPGITAAVAFRSSEGRLQVLGMDVTLAEISRFTSRQRVLGEGGVFVLTEDGRLLGVPHRPYSTRSREEVESMILKRPAEIDTDAARDAAQELLGSEDRWNRAVRIVTEGTPWWGRITPFELSPSQRLLVGVSIPETEILRGINQQRLWVIAITLAVLGVALLRIMNLARRYSRPIELLVEGSHRISTGDFEKGPPIRSRITEVQELAEAHDEMRAGLETLMKLEQDLRVARDVQHRTFPQKLPELEGFDIAAWNEPADQTGGDSYDVVGLRDGGQGIPSLTQDEAERAVLMLADATGHGIGPALSVTQLRAMLRMAVRLNPGTSGIIEQINQQLWSDLPAQRFITAWFGILDAKDCTLIAFSAAQAPLLLFRASEERFEYLSSNSVALGMFPTIKVDIPDPISMQSGDIYAAISDGIFEAGGTDDEEMGTDRVAAVIERYRSESAAQIIDRIREATDSFTGGAPADDDRTIILIKRI